MSMHKPVFRYTVDEIMGEELVRLMRAPLLSPDPDRLYRDDLDDWGDEEELIARRSELGPLFDGNVEWKDLQEGQVFLTGNVRMEGPSDRPTGFRLSGTPARRPQRIDSLSADEVLYAVSDLITRKR